MSLEPINWSPGVTLEAVEKQVILKAFRFYRGNKTQTSSALGITVQTLNNKLEKYEEEGKQQREREDREQVERQEVLNRMRGVGTAHEAQARGALFHAPNAGVRVEPAPEVAQESALPVSKRKEVQGVLPRQASAGGNGSRGKAV